MDAETILTFCLAVITLGTIAVIILIKYYTSLKEKEAKHD
jgi:hypothetical protein